MIKASEGLGIGDLETPDAAWISFDVTALLLTLLEKQPLSRWKLLEVLHVVQQKMDHAPYWISCFGGQFFY